MGSPNRSDKSDQISEILKLIAFGTTLIAIALIVGVVYLIRDVVALIIVSFVIGHILNPIVNAIEQKGTNRTLATIITILIILFGSIFISMFAVSQIAKQITAISQDVEHSEARDQIVSVLVKGFDSLPSSAQLRLIGPIDENAEIGPIAHEKISELVETSMQRIANYFSTEYQQIFGVIGSSVKSIFSSFTAGIILLFLTFFFVSGSREMKKSIMSAVPNRFFEPMLVLLHELSRQLGSYIRSRVIQTVMLAVLCAIGYLILGLRFAIILGLIAGLANLIPYIGPFIGAIPAVFVLLIGSRFGIGWGLIGIGVITLTVQIVDSAIIFPLFIGKSVELGPITTIAVIFIGEQFMGLVGLLMAVPITAMIKLITKEIATQFKGYSRSIIGGG